MRRTLLSVFSLFLLTAPLPLFAGTFIKSITQSYTDKNDWHYGSVAIDQGKLRMDIQGPDNLTALLSGKKGESGKPAMDTWTILFDQNTSQLDLVIGSKKTVYEITGADLAKIKEVLDLVAAELQKDLKDPKKMKKKDRQEFLKTKRLVHQFLDQSTVPAASGVSINGYTCDKYVVSFQKKKMMDFWCAPVSSVPITPQDFQTSQALVNLLLDMAGDFAALFDVDIEKVKQHPYFQKFSVLSIDYDDKGKPKELYRLLEVRPQTYPPETFETPATYARVNVLQLVNQLITSKGAKTSSAPGNPSPAQPPVQ